MRLVEHLAYRHEPEVGRILRVLGDGQPVGDEQLREIHLDDHRRPRRRVRLDHPFALGRHRKRPRETGRGDDAPGPGQRLVRRRAARWPGFATIAAAVAFAGLVGGGGGRRCRAGQRGHGDGQQARARAPPGEPSAGPGAAVVARPSRAGWHHAVRVRRRRPGRDLRGGHVSMC